MVIDPGDQRIERLLRKARRLRQIGGHDVLETEGLHDLAFTIFKEMSWILNVALELIFGDGALRRIAMCCIAALENAPDLAGEPGVQSEPDRIAAPPGGTIAARLVPIGRLLQPFNLEAGGVADHFTAKGPP